MIDGSGSLKSAGFNVLRTFAANLTKKYMAEYYGVEDMAIGVVLFGNGAIEADGTIAWGLQVQGLTFDLADTRTKISAMTWQRGFTNMAQGFSMADKILGEGGRSSAQSAVMVITDGKLNFEFQTEQSARALHDKNTMIFMVPVTEMAGEDLNFLKQKLASQPWETNFLRIPGLEALKTNEELFIQQAVAKFCPRAMSPTTVAAQANALQYILVREQTEPDYLCADWRDEIMFGKVEDADACAGFARDYNRTSFMMQEAPRSRFVKKVGYYCMGLLLPVTNARWTTYIGGLDPNATICDTGGTFSSPYVNIYALKPMGLIGM